MSFYITTPIYYVNDKPHLGHAYTNVAADVIARIARLQGNDVSFLTGTDEHGQKVEQSAIKRGKAPQEFANEGAELFRDLAAKLNLSHSAFIRTSSGQHKQCASDFWDTLYRSGNIYLDKYEGWYSVRDEAFYDESELKDGLAPTGAPVEWVVEDSYFFALSRWQDRLLEFYEANPNFILPISRRSEVVNFVKGGLHDLSISRTSFSWGIPVPNDPKHLMYVWLDALSSYRSGVDATVWPADVHVIGKDILRFHAVYWPAFLMAAGLPLPRCILAHGWWTNRGQKMSKSLGNVIDPLDLLERFGVDYVRYYMMRDTSFGSDANFDEELLVQKINSEVVNKLGNLMQRTVSFFIKAFGGTVTVAPSYQEPILSDIGERIEQVMGFFASYQLNRALEQIMAIVESGNLYMEQMAPWKLVKTDGHQAQMVLMTILELCRCIGILLQPFMPGCAAKLLGVLGLEGEVPFMHLGQDYALRVGMELHFDGQMFKRL